MAMTATQEYNLMYWEQVAKEEQARQARYKRAWLYYNSKHDKTLFVKVGQADDNLTMNLYAYIIDKGVSFLFGKELEFQLEEGTDTESEKFLRDVWAANDKMAFLQDVALNGGLCGHCFVEIAPQINGTFELINHDPAYVYPQWDGENLRKVLYYKIEFPMLNPVTGKMEYRKRMIELQENGTWKITKYVKREGDVRYTQDGAPVLWEYPFPPIVDWQNLPLPNSYFGRPDIDETDGQDALNFAYSNAQKIFRYHGHPKTIGKGFNAANVNVAPDEMIVLPTSDADVKNLEIQGDLNAAREDRKLLATIFLQTHHVPNLSDVDVSLGAASGFSLQIRYGDLLSRTNMKRLRYGRGIMEINRRLLVLAGREEKETTKLNWQNPLPENKAEAVDELIKEIDAKLTSMETARAELGRDNEVEQERIAAEQTQGNNIGAQLLRAFNSGQGQ